MRGSDAVLQYHKAVISPAYFVPDPTNEERMQEDLDEADWLKSYVPQAKDINEVMQPMSDYYYP
jgi:hypothetical protein